MKRQQARTASASGRDRERERESMGRTGEALRCQPSQAEAARLARLARTMPKRAS